MARRVSTDSHGYGRRRDLSTQTSQQKQDRVSRGNKESSADADTQTDPPQERPCGGRWQTLLKTETTRASHRDRSAIPPHAQSAPRAGARPAPHSSCPPGTLVCRAQSGCQNGTTTTSPTLTWLRNPELQHTPWHSATTQQAALATAGGHRTTASGQQAMPSGRTSRQLSGPRRPCRAAGHAVSCRGPQAMPSAAGQAVSCRGPAGQAEDSASSQGLSHLRLWRHQKMRFCRRTWDKNQHRRESRGPAPTTTQTCTRLHEPETAPQKTRTSRGQSPPIPEISYPP